jgi:hypothetical protein
VVVSEAPDWSGEPVPRGVIPPGANPPAVFLSAVFLSAQDAISRALSAVSVSCACAFADPAKPEALFARTQARRPRGKRSLVPP